MRLSQGALDEVLHGLLLELMGPCPGWSGTVSHDPYAPSLLAVPPLGRQLPQPPTFVDQQSARGLWQLDGAEVLATTDHRDSGDGPGQRYGVGVLWPRGLTRDDQVSTENESELLASAETNLVTSSDGEELLYEPPKFSATAEGVPDEDADTLDASEGSAAAALAGTSGRLQSSMGVSFLVDDRRLPSGAILVCELQASRYERLAVHIAGREVQWWKQVPIVGRAMFSLDSVPKRLVVEQAVSVWPQSTRESIHVTFLLVARRLGTNGLVVTVTAQNRTHVQGESRRRDETALFQTRIGCWVESSSGGAVADVLLAYPESPISELGGHRNSDLVRLQHRETGTFALGHGCAADWSAPAPGMYPQHVERVFGVPVPIVCLPALSPSVIPPGDGQGEIAVRMRDLAEQPITHCAEVLRLADEYEKWIHQKRESLAALEGQVNGVDPTMAGRFSAAGNAQLDRCDEALRRIRAGIDFLARDHQAGQAFRLANHAILLAQAWSGWSRGDRLAPLPDTWDTAALEAASGAGSWRPFQLAFMLSTIESLANPMSVDRDRVDVLWFPTGGGKTEAYLGLMAFTLILARLRDPMNSGVGVIMRYTLRLLTRQQLQRASAVVCAMEAMRLSHPAPQPLGRKPFRIGMWVGRDASPNSRKDARRAYGDLLARPNAPARLVPRCPRCSTYIGTTELLLSAGPLPQYEVKGVREAGRGASARILYFCPNTDCIFGNELPVLDVDDDIFDLRPSVLVGTVDKFAGLAWHDDYRQLFGIDRSTCDRTEAPPSLIIQDELHLITGPLGSTTALYETALEELCTDRRREGVVIRPKIVASSATLSGFEDQVRHLFARTSTVAFPPGGIETGDSFFASAVKPDGVSVRPGKVYVGLFPANYPSGQTAQVRTFAALLQSASPTGLPAVDPYWTNLVFFGTKSELGQAQSLYQADVPDYLDALHLRSDMIKGGSREKERRDTSLSRVVQLTGDVSREEIETGFDRLAAVAPVATDGLASGGTEDEAASEAEMEAVDACLATNVIEVGVDVDRLALMTVIGQPKAASSYIQATGRVGRRWREAPGLVVCLFGNTKTRDQSHYERFRSFHEHLQTNVEPVSITPFAEPLLDRAGHAVALALLRTARLSGSQLAEGPTSITKEDWEWATAALVARAQVVDPAAVTSLNLLMGRRWSELSAWRPQRWMVSLGGQETALSRHAGSYTPQDLAETTWELPTSMRTVDLPCMPEVTSFVW